VSGLFWRGEDLLEEGPTKYVTGTAKTYGLRINIGTLLSVFVFKDTIHEIKPGISKKHKAQSRNV